MQLSNEWFAAAEDTDMGMIIVRGRLHLDTIRNSHTYNTRIELQWQYKGDNKGMPSDTESEVIDHIMNIMCETLERSNTAVLTAIHTGAQQIRYIFYTTTIEAFSKQIDPLIQRVGNLPIRIGATLDAQWQEYTSMIARHALQ